jgi:addiction module HigA family antidote
MTAVLQATNTQDGSLIELTHPGEMLREDFLEPLGLSAYKLSRAIGVQQTRILEILRGQRDISAETSLLLDRFFGLSDGYWLRLQTDYNLRKARHALAARLTQVQPYIGLQETAA